MNAVNTIQQVSQSRLIPVTDWSKYHPYPPLGGLRHLIFMAPPGFEKVIVRIGRRVLINELEFFRWASTNPSIRPQGGLHG